MTIQVLSYTHSRYVGKAYMTIVRYTYYILERGLVLSLVHSIDYKEVHAEPSYCSALSYVCSIKLQSL